MAQLTTFVFTDLVGSVALKQRMPGVDAVARDEAYIEQVLRPHRERIEAGLADADGRVVSTAGDGHFLVFPDTARAALWAIGVLRAHEEGTAGAAATPGAFAEVRIGMHAGTPQPDPADPDNFVGRAVDYAARLSDHAQGGQVLVSRTTASLIEDGALEGVRLHTHGPHELKGIGEVELYELLHSGKQPSRPRRTPSEAGERSWSVLPRTMGLTEYVAQSGSKRPSDPSGDDGSDTSVLTAVRPRRVGNYELLELIGAGGMGNVYKARHAQFDRPRAVKIIRPDLVESGGEGVVRRFYQEVRATGSLEHPNLVVAIDSSRPEDHEHYLVMEYVDGVSLDELLRATGPLPIADACEIARQAALGLAHLHEQSLVHRDVKPSNLMLTLANSPHLPVDVTGSVGSGSVTSRTAGAKLPVVKLMDLGLALLAPAEGEERLTRMDRGGMGTGYYMPPEQWRTTSVDIRADVYSLGCTLFHLLMGEPPFAKSDLKQERAHALESPPALHPACGAPRELADLVGRMLAKQPKDRPQTPLEVAEALEPLAAGHRLAERVAGFRVGDASTRRRDALETRRELEEAAETNTPSSRRLTGSAAEAARQGSWWIAGLATLVACGAILALTYARQAMLQRHVDRLETTSRFASRAVAQAVDKRIGTLVSLADEEELRTRLRTAVGTGAAADLQQWLSNRRTKTDDQLDLRSSSWFVTDAEGNQLARAPKSPTIGANYAHRDYFHGLGHDLPRNPDPAPEPIRDPWQSAVYASGTSGELKVAFSTPIYDQREVIGVLAMSVMLGDFSEFDDADADARDVEILLVDLGQDFIADEASTGLVLHHRALKQFARDGAAVRMASDMVETVRREIASPTEKALPTYEDVFGREGGAYWGVASRVRPSKLSARDRDAWVVIAQEPKP